MKMDLTPEEQELIENRRNDTALDVADCAALRSMMQRAKSTEERHQMQLMIAARGGGPVTHCRCGAPVMPKSGALHECGDCYIRAYGK